MWTAAVPRAYDLSRQLRAEGLFYESQTMLELNLLRQVRSTARQLLHDRWSSPTVPAEIERFVMRFINCHRGTPWKVNQLLQHIERSWPYLARGSGDPMNNVTERVIGLTYKIWAKTMRGFKSPLGDAHRKVSLSGLRHIAPYLAAY